MKVLMILDNLSQDSGVSSIVMNLYNKIDKSKVKIDFLIFREGNNSFVDYIRLSGSKVFCLSNPLSIKTFFKGIFELRNFFRDYSCDYDIVHLHSPSMAEFTLRYAYRYNIPHRIIHSHSTMSSFSAIKRVLNYFLQRNVCVYANHYWACSTEAAVFLFGRSFYKTHNIQLIKNAVNPEKYYYDSVIRGKTRKELDWINCTIALHVSNFNPIKNLRFLVSIIEESTKSNELLRFLFVGEGPSKQIIERELQDKGLSKYVLFIGRSGLVNKYLNCADVLLLPSIKEGLPLTVIEAQACGLRCLVSKSVTKEVDVGNVTFLPLNKYKWIRELLLIKPLGLAKRKEYCNKFKESCFNVNIEAKRVEKLYLEMRGARDERNR